MRFELFYNSTTNANSIPIITDSTTVLTFSSVYNNKNETK